MGVPRALAPRDTGETLEDFTDERCAEHIRRAVGVPDLDVEITGKAPWHAAERVAERYSLRPGLPRRRLGPRDVPDRGVRLQHRYPGRAQPGLEARRGAGRLGGPGAAGDLRRGAAAGGPGDQRARLGPLGRAQPPGIRAAARGRRAARAACWRWPWATATCAARSSAPIPQLPVVPDRMGLDGEPGSRAPHLWVDRAGERVSTLDLYERTFVLLCDAGDEVWRPAAARAAERLTVRLEAYGLGSGPGADLVTEKEADWAGAHGVGADGAVLVRPDGFVAWRSAGAVPDAEGALHEVLTTVLHRA